MSEDEPTGGPTTNEEGTTGQRRSARRATSRRAFLATGAVVSTASLVGCLGGSSAGSAGTPTTGSEPDTPWTTDELVDYVDDGTTVTIYAGSGEQPTWNSLVDVINDEFDAGLEADVVTAGGSQISQRIIQERQAEEDQADLVASATDIRNQIYEEGDSVAERYYEWDVDGNFWFSEDLEEYMTLPWGASAFNGGASSVMPINADIFEERGLDVPTSYNDLFDDQYEGMEMIIPTGPVTSQIGWIIGYHADQTDMDDMEWMRAIVDHFDVTGYNSHSDGGRAVGQGKVPIMFYNFPWTIAELVEEFPLVGNFVEPVKWNTFEGLFSINSEAPHPWAARLVLSAMLEAPVQRRMIDEVPNVTAARTELDLSDVEMSDYARERLTTQTTPVGFWEGQEYTEIGQRAVEEAIDF
ncbi:transporter [Halosimplex amylolyticum]|uniref:transporter n=1 Tax=Halosimplex amylolyticum TaxID=3396616 RepID=UPI003F547F0B